MNPILKIYLFIKYFIKSFLWRTESRFKRAKRLINVFEWGEPIRIIQELELNPEFSLLAREPRCADSFSIYAGEKGIFIEFLSHEWHPEFSGVDHCLVELPCPIRRFCIPTYLLEPNYDF